MRVLIETEDQLEEILPDLREYIEQPKARLALDVETSVTKPEYEFPLPYLMEDGLVGKVQTIQLGCDPKIYPVQYILDVRKLGDFVIHKHLKPILEQVMWLGHNIKYDVGFMIMQFDIWPKAGVRCTMLNSQIINAGNKFEHSLGGCYDLGYQCIWRNETLYQPGGDFCLAFV